MQLIPLQSPGAREKKRPDSYEFCQAGNGQIGRRRLLGSTRIALCGEVYLPHLGRWRLRSELLSAVDFPTVDAEVVLALAPNRDVLALGCPAPADLAQHRSGVHLERLDWPDRAIEDTLRKVLAEESDVETELSFSRGDSSESDFEFDMTRNMLSSSGRSVDAGPQRISAEQDRRRHLGRRLDGRRM
jgi:hypothetical protein